MTSDTRLGLPETLEALKSFQKIAEKRIRAFVTMVEYLDFFAAQSDKLPPEVTPTQSDKEDALQMLSSIANDCTDLASLMQLETLRQSLLIHKLPEPEPEPRIASNVIPVNFKKGN
jgi:hypothetical protein